MMTIRFLVIFTCLLALPICGWAGSQLTPSQYERVKQCKQMLRHVDSKTLGETVSHMESGPYLEERVLIYEAMAKTYTEIIAEFQVTEKSKMEGLYSMIEQNMAYLQLGGGGGGTGFRAPLYSLIRRKLKNHLPEGLMNNPDLFYSEGWINE